MTASVPLGGSAWAGATGVLDGNVSERAPPGPGGSATERRRLRFSIAERGRDQNLKGSDRGGR